MLNKTLLFIIGGAFLVSCATKPKGPNAQTKKYVEFVKSVDKQAAVEASLLCPKTKKLYIGKNWKKLMTMTNDCVQSSKWSRVQELAYYMAEIDPHSPWGVYYQSLYSENKKDLKRALWMITSAQNRAPNMALFSFQKARIHWQLGENQQAVGEFEKTIDLDPKFTAAHSFLGQVYTRGHQYKKAIKHLKVALEDKKYSKYALIGLGECYYNTSDYQESLKYLKRATSFYPRDLRLRLRIADIYENHLQDKKSALSAYRKLKGLKSTAKKANLKTDVNLKIQTLEKLIEDEQKQRKISSSKQEKAEG